jgi:hypothetical protein
VSRDIEPLEGELEEKYKEQGYDVEAADYVATEIHNWRDLATVVNGASPSNEITVGDNPMKAEALHAAVESLADLGDLTEDTLVRWDSSGDRDAYGMVVGTISEGSYDDEISGDVTVDAPAALIEVHTPGSDGWEATETMVAHKPDTLSVIDELPTPESLEEHGDMDLTPPEQAQTNAQKVLDWRDEHGDEVDAMTDTGWNRAEQLASGEELTPEVVKKMAQFNRHRGNSGVSDEYEGEPWKDNGHVAWLGWGGDAGVDWAINKSESLNESMAGAHESDSGEETSGTHEALKEVAGVEFDGTTTGKLDESEIPSEGFESHYLYPGENKSESSYPVVDADGNLRKGNVDSAWQLGARGDADADTHDSRLMDLANEFENPPEWVDNADAMSGAQVKDPALWEACSVSLPESITVNDDGANGGLPQSSADADDSKTMTEEDTLSDDEKAILSAAEDVEDATEALQSFADKEDPTVVENDNYEALNSRVDTLKDMMGERLVEDTGLKESTVESMSFEAMAKEFETDDGDFDAEALVQQPESGEPEADESGVEALSEDADKEKAEALYNDYQNFGNDRLKEDITEALGVSDFETAEEVLN